MEPWHRRKHIPVLPSSSWVLFTMQVWVQLWLFKRRCLAPHRPQGYAVPWLYALFDSRCDGNCTQHSCKSRMHGKVLRAVLQEIARQGLAAQYQAYPRSAVLLFLAPIDLQ